MKIKQFCICGAGISGTISPDSKADVVLKAWNAVHSGQGHGPTDAKTARKNRFNEENKLKLIAVK